MTWQQLKDNTWPDFETRQRLWKGELREFRQHHGRGEVRVWRIWVEGNRVSTQHGQLNGALQDTNYIGKEKNIGKSNAITAVQDALAEARRDARKKWDFEGYDEYAHIPLVSQKDNYINIDHRNQDISIDALLTNLPGSFSLYKPEHDLYDQKSLLEKARKGKVLYTLKRDGIAKWVVVDYYGNIQIYSRRSRPYQDTEGPKELFDGTLDWTTAVPWSKRFPHLIEDIKRLDLPPGTMMACELVAPINHGKDNFVYVSGLTKGYTIRALDDMEKYGYPRLYWWDMPFYKGECLLDSLTVKDRYSLIYIHSAMAGFKSYIDPIQYVEFKTPEDAVDYARLHGLEGWVVVDPDAIYGDKGWNLKGKPDRPKSCAKLKPTFEGDFIADWDPDLGIGEWGTGKHEAGKTVTLPSGSKVVHGGVGSVALYQKSHPNGEHIFISNCSSGMDYEFQARLRKNDFPFVAQIEYKGRTYIKDGDKTNALRHPVWVRVRTDKETSECINEKL